MKPKVATLAIIVAGGISAANAADLDQNIDKSGFWLGAAAGAYGSI
ncbi:hypothetical protein P4S64_06305 [Vibrio sp. M60_M31a]